MTTINKIEIEKFSRLSKDWWNPNGKFKPLHLFNPARIKFIKEKLISYYGFNPKNQEPLKKKSDVVRLNTIVYVSLEIIRKVSILLNPIIPATSLKVLDIFNIKQKDINFDTIKDNKFLKPNSNIKKIEILFKKIEKND